MSVPYLKAVVSVSKDDEVETETTASTTSEDASGDEHETETADNKVEQGWTMTRSRPRRHLPAAS